MRKMLLVSVLLAFAICVGSAFEARAAEKYWLEEADKIFARWTDAVHKDCHKAFPYEKRPCVPEMGLMIIGGAVKSGSVFSINSPAIKEGEIGAYVYVFGGVGSNAANALHSAANESFAGGFLRKTGDLDYQAFNYLEQKFYNLAVKMTRHGKNPAFTIRVYFYRNSYEARVYFWNVEKRFTNFYSAAEGYVDFLTFHESFPGAIDDLLFKTERHIKGITTP